MRIKKTFSADQQGVGDLLSYTGETLEGWKVEDKNLMTSFCGLPL